MFSLTEGKQTSVFSCRSVTFHFIYLFGAKSTQINPYEENVVVFCNKVALEAKNL